MWRAASAKMTLSEVPGGWWGVGSGLGDVGDEADELLVADLHIIR